MRDESALEREGEEKEKGVRASQTVQDKANVTSLIEEAVAAEKQATAPICNSFCEIQISCDNAPIKNTLYFVFENYAPSFMLVVPM